MNGMTKEQLENSDGMTNYLIKMFHGLNQVIFKIYW